MYVIHRKKLHKGNTSTNVHSRSKVEFTPSLKTKVHYYKRLFKCIQMNVIYILSYNKYHPP